MSVNRVDISGQDIPHFIGSWLIANPVVCDELIHFFKTNVVRHEKGNTSTGVDDQIKLSTDLSLRPRELGLDSHEYVRNYLDILHTCYRDYLEQWPFLKGIMPKINIGPFNIQEYLPGGHFKFPHTERFSLASSHRVLAWMTYLNDVDDGGSTSFHHQKIDIQPRKGLTLIWPAEWTHAHSGNIVNSGMKYIITGWMHFPVEDPE